VEFFPNDAPYMDGVPSTTNETEEFRIRSPRGLYILWVTATIGGSALGHYLGVIPTGLFAFGWAGYDPPLHDVMVLLAVAVAIWQVLLSALQGLVVQQVVSTSLKRWVLLTTFGPLCAWFLVGTSAADHWATGREMTIFQMTTLGSLMGLFAGIGQAALLPKGQFTIVWVITTAVAYGVTLVAFPFIVGTLESLIVGKFEVLLIVLVISFFALPGAILGSITGLPLVFLWKRSSREKRA
jgi:hypothetical protein